MKLSIVIPAYNEEQAIGAIIERCLAAREPIVRASPIDAVEVIVVSDGSTDRTVEIASKYEGIRLVVFEKNRGYGAAIKRGFEEADGDVLGFLDADGTCDPNFFGNLCQALASEQADVAIGSRLGPQSRMPRVRRIGNRIYAFILSLLSNKVVTDTASGMRVIRRDALRRLYPLPDGLHFTPAMSARVLMDSALTIVERPMPYEERVGESKLHVVRDGVRFLRTILEMTLVWRPERVFVSLALVLMTAMTLWAMHPIEQWLRLGRFDQDLIYRLLFCSFLGTLGVSVLSGAVICFQLRRILADFADRPSFLGLLLDRAFTPSGFGLCALPAGVLIIWLIGPGLWTWITGGFVGIHWSRVVLAGLIAFALAQMLLTVLLVHLLRFHAARNWAGLGQVPSRTSRAASSSLMPPSFDPRAATPASAEPATIA